MSSPWRTLVTSTPDADGHPSLSRIQIPRNRGRLPFKERAHKVVHAPPPKVKQFKLKSYREPAQTNSASAKLKFMKDKGKVRGDADTQIRQDVSAVDNFLYLNKLIGNSHRMVPITSSEQPFVMLLERELAIIFWRYKALKEKLMQLGKLENAIITSIDAFNILISGKEPGILTKMFIVDIDPQGLMGRQKRKAGHRAAVKLLTLDEIRSHLNVVKKECLVPVTYAEKGYALRSAVKTRGLCIQFHAFKLQDVRNRRLDDNRLPPRLTSTAVEERLLEFYADRDHLQRWHQWDLERTRQYEYQLLADRLFGIVGGSIGTQRDLENPVLIGVGLGKFSMGSGLSSLDSSFLSFFVQKVYHHRDVMAAENMANVIQAYLVDQERPEYLHTVAADGSLPWMAKAGTGPASSFTIASSSGNTAASSINRPK
ncbi:MAG: hypothetical protein J3R72DRAFT_416918 [Linnemannia gamsii]|nr:MAG: hypothetical protein J3R72DRAFT_416918 [Linnemannia gamsii]